MRAEKGQWQQHMNNSRMAKRGHKEGKKRAKPETVRMPRMFDDDDEKGDNGGEEGTVFRVVSEQCREMSVAVQSEYCPTLPISTLKMHIVHLHSTILD